MSHRRVVEQGEVYLASYFQNSGEVKRSGFFKLEPGTSVQSQLTGLFPPVIAINEEGRDTQPFASTTTISDVTGGLGIQELDATGNLGRFWFAKADTRFRRQVTLPKKKTLRENSDAGDREPRFGVAFQGGTGYATYVAFDERVYRYQTEAWSASLHSFTGGGIPQSPPVIWGSHLYWFLGSNGITYTNDGATFVNISVDAVAGVVIGDFLYIVSTAGLVRRTGTNPPGAVDFVDIVGIGETPTGMLAYLSAGGAVVPYVVAARKLYAIDVDGPAASPAGPDMPPAPYPIRAAVLSSDNQLYIAQGMSVLAWDGENARPVGLDLDDGTPTEFTGGIRRLVNGNMSLFAIVDSSLLTGDFDEGDVYSGDPYRDVVVRGESYAIIYSREAAGWHYRASSDIPVSEATMMFISDADNTYRLWFGWGGDVYTLDLETGWVNPLDDPTGEFEAEGEIIYPAMNFGYLENKKIGLMVRCRTKRCSVDETIKLYVRYDDSDAWYELRNADGSHGITTNGRHTFRLHASPIPLDTDPLEYPDEPAVGYAHDTIQIKAVLTRGADATLSPGLVFIGVDVLKSTLPLTGWTVNIDITKPYKQRSPQEMSDLLHELVHDNASGLLVFAFEARADDFPAEFVYPVKVTSFQSRETTGEGHRKRKTIRMSLTEVTVDEDAEA